NSSHLVPLSQFNVGVTMVITVAQDGSYYRFPSPYFVTQEIVVSNHMTTTEYVSTQTNPLYSSTVNETINGNLGYASPGDLNWWAYGLHFEIVANMPVSSLVAVAESMT
ncbi:MAG TPA: hypothetical protein VKF39_06370, partial [Nitrososphaerales archaeon]|nr:hypothetical protein [Nitrososphaerales archaeon]